MKSYKKFNNRPWTQQTLPKSKKNWALSVVKRELKEKSRLCIYEQEKVQDRKDL